MQIKCYITKMNNCFIGQFMLNCSLPASDVVVGRDLVAGSLQATGEVVVLASPAEESAQQE